MMNSSSSISKIHFTSSTGVSLNDRFTAMTKVSGPPLGVTVTGLERPRVRSNSVSRMDSNRQLVDQWDRSHAMQTAMQLKNNAIRRPVARQRVQRNAMALQVKRTMDKIAGGIQRLQRASSFTDIATMNADRYQLQKARGRAPSITSRLGNTRKTRQGRSMSRGRSVSRGRSGSRARSTSRGRGGSLSRANSQTNLRRAASRDLLTRVGSRTNLARAGSRNNLSSRIGSRNGLNTAGRKAVAPNDARRRLNRNTALAANRTGTNGAANRSRSRSRSRVRAAAAAAVATTAANNGGGRARARKRAGSRNGRNVRSGSVNSRLGTNRTNEPVVAAGRRAPAVARPGRVTKRSGSRRRRGVQNATAVGTRAGRPLKREPTNQRKGAGGKAQQQQGNGKAANGNGTAAAAEAAGRRGRSRSRRANSRVRGRSASKNRTPAVKQQPKSREQLDSELDQYMASTRSTLDNEMREYINGAGSSRI